MTKAILLLSVMVERLLLGLPVAAQDIIHAILVLSSLIVNDADVSPYLQVIMIGKLATIANDVIPAAEISGRFH